MECFNFTRSHRDSHKAIKIFSNDSKGNQSAEQEEKISNFVDELKSK